MYFWRYGIKCINSNYLFSCIPTIYGIRLIFYFPAAVPLLSAYYPSDPTFLPIVYDFPRCMSLVSGSILNCSRAGSPPRSLPSMEAQATPATATATAGPRRTRRQVPPRPLLPANVSLGLPLSNSIATPYSFLVGVRCDSKMQLSDGLTSKMLITFLKKRADFEKHHVVDLKTTMKEIARQNINCLMNSEFILGHFCLLFFLFRFYLY